MKRIAQTVRGDFPALGGRGLRLASGSGHDQAFAQGANDKKFVRQAGQGRVEVGRFIALADAEDARHRGETVGLGARACPGEQQQDYEPQMRPERRRFSLSLPGGILAFP